MTENELKECSKIHKATVEVVGSVEAELYTRVRGYIANPPIGVNPRLVTWMALD